MNVLLKDMICVVLTQGPTSTQESNVGEYYTEPIVWAKVAEMCSSKEEIEEAFEETRPSTARALKSTLYSHQCNAVDTWCRNHVHNKLVKGSDPTYLYIYRSLRYTHDRSSIRVGTECLKDGGHISIRDARYQLCDISQPICFRNDKVCLAARFTQVTTGRSHHEAHTLSPPNDNFEENNE